MADILPVGIIEIAEKLGVKRATVDQWIQRDIFPAPDWTVGGRPAWEWSTIARWAEVTGRKTITIVELTERFGLPADQQSAVASWTGDPWGTTWSEEDADQLHQAWETDQLRIDDEQDEAEEPKTRYVLVDKGANSETSRVVAIDPGANEGTTVFTGPTNECQDWMEHETGA